VETLLRGSDEVLLPFPVLMETYYISLRERSEDVADRRYALLRQLPATFLWSMDEPTLLTSARFKARYPLSLADAIMLLPFSMGLSWCIRTPSLGLWWSQFGRKFFLIRSEGLDRVLFTDRASAVSGVHHLKLSRRLLDRFGVRGFSACRHFSVSGRAFQSLTL